MQEAVQLQVIGAPVVRVGGQEVKFKTRKALALLCYLALEGATPQDTLLELLWPDAPHSGSLRTASLYLRHALGTQAWRLQTQWCGLSFESKGVEIDALQLEQLSAEEALRSGHGEFLAGLYLKGNPAWDDYLMTRGEELRLQFDRRLSTLIQAAHRQGDFDTAHRLAQRRYQLDPLSAEACEQWASTLEQAGQPGRAAAARTTFQQRFEREFGLKRRAAPQSVVPGRLLPA